jgi:hypothetical protein
MPHQLDLGETQIREYGNGDVDATKHQFPQKVLEAFIKNAPRGSKAIYCRGPFLNARSLGAFAREMHLRGLCDLVQQRIHIGSSTTFEYLMVKR